MLKLKGFAYLATPIDATAQFAGLDRTPHSVAPVPQLRQRWSMRLHWPTRME
jgi:hypothetical protein